MDVQYFLKRQLSFIRQFYDISSAPFIERKRLIEAEEYPFSPPPYYGEDPEPYFLQEFIEADESLQVLGCVCVSMLSNVFKIYFKEWDRRIGQPDIKKNINLKCEICNKKVIDAKPKDEITKAFEKGFLNGYRAYFAQFDVNFEDSPSKLEVLEEIVLVRNKAQHLESITMNTQSYSVHELKKLRPPFFMDDYTASQFSNAGEGNQESFEFLAFLEDTSIRVTGEKLFAAISEMEVFTEWLENLWNTRDR
ncbi:MAG: hypothetical protein Q8Q40_06025 [Methylococcaceae bacterium]|nr:hypothetical protein [Methylococcaceae bacterium]MDP3903513.1 hypothetical protein [Methylococcaceae bacterium]